MASFALGPTFELNEIVFVRVLVGEPDILQHLVNNGVWLPSAFTSQILTEPSELSDFFFPWLSQGGQVPPFPSCLCSPMLASGLCFSF